MSKVWLAGQICGAPGEARGQGSPLKIRGIVPHWGHVSATGVEDKQWLMSRPG